MKQEIKSAEDILANSANVRISDVKRNGDHFVTVNEALDAIHEYHTQFKGEWVSVEDDKPKMGQDVICTDNHTCYSIGWYSDPEGFFTDKKMNVTHYMIFNSVKV